MDPGRSAPVLVSLSLIVKVKGKSRRKRLVAAFVYKGHELIYTRRALNSLCAIRLSAFTMVGLTSVFWTIHVRHSN